MIPETCPTLKQLAIRQLAVFPSHEKYLRKRFEPVDAAGFAFAEKLAKTVESLVGDEMETHLADYRWMCEMVVEEEIAFRRSGEYRLSTFEDAEREVYANRKFMTQYMNGLLISQLWWRNHTEVMFYYQNTYLKALKPGFRHLEIGPGHGLFLGLAADSDFCGTSTGWDVSEASIAMTKRALSILKPRVTSNLELVNMFSAAPGMFDSLVFSEVLEHLEKPAEALEAISRLLDQGGFAFINAPVNSPAPDHLALFRAPEEIVDLVKASGLEVVHTLFSPTSGVTLEIARKRAMAISTAVIARKN
jgi:2-polyprenyl-3-methyl-5-hydroxy-6-metoxy-1,4-benzoquinol methylase